MTSLAKPVENGTITGVSHRHQKNVEQWIKEKSRMLEGLKGSEDTRFLIDGRFWHVWMDITGQGGVVLYSQWNSYYFFAEWIPHKRGQYGKIKFNRIKADIGQGIEEAVEESDLKFA